MMSVATTFAMVAFACWFESGRTECWKRFVILNIRLLVVRCGCAGSVTTARARVGARAEARSGWDERREKTRCHGLSELLLLLQGCGETGRVDICGRFVVRVARGRLKGGEAVVILQLKVWWELLRCIRPAVRDSQLLHERRRIVREEAVLACEAIAL